jgi:probable F420-dependent oxidoreductase
VTAIHLPQDHALFRSYPALAGELEAAGYDALWVGEVNDIDAVTAATLAASGTKRADIGVLLNAFTRAPGTLAMTAASLGHLAPGRVNIVLGVASPLLVERWNGIPYARPAARLTDVLRFLRAVLSGERVEDTFETFSTNGFRLPAPLPEAPPRLLVAACGPRALRLAADQADGVVLNWLTADDLDRVEPLPAHREAISIVVPACPSADVAIVDQTMRPVLADYLAAPAYADQQRRLGRGPALQPMWDAWTCGDRDRARAQVPWALIDELVVHGSPSSCRQQLVEIERRAGTRVIATYFDVPDIDYRRAVLATAPDPPFDESVF